MNVDVEKAPLNEIKREWRQGWPVVLSACLGYGTGGALLNMALGLFIKPMREGLHWSASAVTITPIMMLVWAVSSPVCGLLTDRFGSRRAAIFGAVMLIISTISLGLMPANTFVLYALAALAGACAPFTNVTSYTRAIASWFRHTAGTAFGITLNGSSLVALFAVPLTAATIFKFGWRAGFFAIAGIMLCVGLPLILLFFRERPVDRILVSQASTKLTGATYKEAAKDPHFWLLLSIFFATAVALGGFMGHFQPLLAYKGFSVGQAAGLGMLYAIFMSAGRIVGGILLDRIWDYAVATILFSLAGIGGLALAHVSLATPLPLVVIAVCLTAMGQGAEGDFIAYFTLKRFGLCSFSTIVGTMSMASSFGIAAGAWIFAHLYDIHGDYVMASSIGGLCYIAGGLSLLIIGIGSQLGTSRSERNASLVK